MAKNKIISAFLLVSLFTNSVSSQNDTTNITSISEVSVVSFFNSNSKLTEFSKNDLIENNYGQEPSNLFNKIPSIFSTNDNGTEFGYGYFRIRGLDQTRINVMLDGCPWNEAEDFGAYFANSPDLMSSMEAINVQRGSNSTNNGIAGSAGNISMESINIWNENDSYVHVGFGSHTSYKTSVVYNMKPTNGWGLHIKGTYQETDGYRKHSFNESGAFTIKTGYKFNNKHSIDLLSMNGYHENGQGWIGNTIEELRDIPNANGNKPSEDDNWFMSMNRIQYKGWLTKRFILTSSIYHQYQTGSYRLDWNNYALHFNPASTLKDNILYDYGLTHYLSGANVTGKVYLSDITANLGINAYNYQRRHYNGDKSINVPNNEKYDNTGCKNDLSIFAILSYKPTNRLSIGGNIQYRYVNFNYKDKLNPDILYNPYKYGTVWNFVNWGLNADYKLNDNWKVYAKYSQVNREPTRSDMFGGYEYFIGEINTNTPEISNDLEVGFDMRYSNFKANLNYYYMWFRNELILNGEYGTNGLPCHENAMESFRTGLECTINWNIINRIYVNANYSHSWNRVLSKTFGKVNHILTPNYTLDFDLYYKDKMWHVGANVNSRSEMFVDMENKHSIPELVTLNLYGSININDIEIGLRCNNITNRTNYNTGMVNAYDEVLYIRNAGFNIHAIAKIFF